VADDFSQKEAADEIIFIEKVDEFLSVEYELER